MSVFPDMVRELTEHAKRFESKDAAKWFAKVRTAVLITYRFCYYNIIYFKGFAIFSTKWKEKSRIGYRIGLQNVSKQRRFD